MISSIVLIVVILVIGYASIKYREKFDTRNLSDLYPAENYEEKTVIQENCFLKENGVLVCPESIDQITRCEGETEIINEVARNISPDNKYSFTYYENALEACDDPYKFLSSCKGLNKDQILKRNFFQQIYECSTIKPEDYEKNLQLLAKYGFLVPTKDIDLGRVERQKEYWQNINSDKFCDFLPEIIRDTGEQFYNFIPEGFLVKKLQSCAKINLQSKNLLETFNIKPTKIVIDNKQNICNLLQLKFPNKLTNKEAVNLFDELNCQNFANIYQNVRDGFSVKNPVITERVYENAINTINQWENINQHLSSFKYLQNLLNVKKINPYDYDPVLRRNVCAFMKGQDIDQNNSFYESSKYWQMFDCDNILYQDSDLLIKNNRPISTYHYCNVTKIKFFGK